MGIFPLLLSLFCRQGLESIGFERQLPGLCYDSFIYDLKGQPWALDRWHSVLVDLEHKTEIPIDLFDSYSELDLAWHQDGPVVFDRLQGKLHLINSPSFLDLALQPIGKLMRPYFRLGSNENSWLFVDGARKELVVFDKKGKFIRVSPIEIDDALDPVAVGAISGTWIILEKNFHRLLFVDDSGQVNKIIGGFGSAPGLFNSPSDLVIFEDLIFVSDSGNDRIQVLDRRGNVITKIGASESVNHTGNGGLHEPQQLIVWRKEGLLKLAISEPLENRVQIFSEASSHIPNPYLSPSAHLGPNIAVHQQQVAMADPESGRIFLFDLRAETPIHTATMASQGNGVANLQQAVSLTFDDAQHLWLLDRGQETIVQVKIVPSANKSVGFNADQLHVARTIRWSHLVEDTSALDLSIIRWQPSAKRIVLFDRLTQSIYSLNENGHLDGQLIDIGLPVIDLACNAGQVLVVSAIAPFVSLYDVYGKSITLGEFGIGPGQLIKPVAVAIVAGNLYVLDQERQKMLIFDAREGTFLSEFGQIGVADGDWWKPSSFAIENNEFFVNDYGNHRVQSFDLNGQWTRTFSTGRTVTRATKAMRQ